ncbi:putative nucleotide-diphospho-sugar transferase [Achromobacter ruhlandii]|uniref:putative nucleotide-diphospho-sugar transferase n=1 Tax=Achromobacter ruhlandii TaxID=72557 RepID=UPI000ACD0FC8|nr:putative nucleotide-diphospho-sugar transferase [Achromobacter ruhlandii]
MFDWFRRKWFGWSAEQTRVVPSFPGPDKAAPAGRGGSATGMVVAFFTRDSIYETEKNRLLRSAQRLGLAVDAEPIESTGSWVRNASMKPSVLVAMRRKHTGPLLYVDVDAVFHRDPWPTLAALDCDIAAYHEPEGHLLSGTLFINHTPAAAELLQAWAQACAENPEEWDQLVLERLLASDAASAAPRYRQARLPVAYCWIFDKTDNAPCAEVFIEHLQASREATQRKHFFGRPVRAVRRRRDRVRAIERILFDRDAAR